MTTQVTPPPPPQRKKITRRKPGEKSSKYYFDDNTQNAIIRFQEAVIVQADGTTKPDHKARDKIYAVEILPAFSTLIENLINVYGYHAIFESRDDLKNECLEFLYGVIDKWKKDRGSKAFAYFNIVAKHWLTIKSKQAAKIVQNYVSIDNRDALSRQDVQSIEDYNVLPSPEDVLTNQDYAKNLKALLAALQDKAKTDNEKLCLKAIQTIADNIDEIELLSKRAVMTYIREITGLTGKQLSMVLSSLKKQYKVAKEEVLR